MQNYLAGAIDSDDCSYPWRREGYVKGIIYRSYHIVGLARLNEKTGYWLPILRVLWHEAGQERKIERDGPSSRFRTRAEAEEYAVVMGKDWVDNQNPVP